MTYVTGRNSVDCRTCAFRGSSQTTGRAGSRTGRDPRDAKRLGNASGETASERPSEGFFP